MHVSDMHGGGPSALLPRFLQSKGSPLICVGPDTCHLLSPSLFLSPRMVLRQDQENTDLLGPAQSTRPSLGPLKRACVLDQLFASAHWLSHYR